MMDAFHDHLILAIMTGDFNDNDADDLMVNLLVPDHFANGAMLFDAEGNELTYRRLVPGRVPLRGLRSVTLSCTASW